MRNSLNLILLLLSTLSGWAAGAQAVAAGSWEPRNYATKLGLKAHYSTMWTNTVTLNGAGVSVWADRSGNGNNLTNGVAANQPTWTNSAAFGSTLYFDGVSDFLKTPAFTLAQPTTVFALVKQVASTSTRTLWDGATLNSGRISQGAGSPQLTAQSGTVTPQTFNTAPLGQWCVIQTRFDGTNTRHRVNLDIPYTSAGYTNSMGGFTLGANGGNLLPSNIEVAEVLIFNRALNTNEEAYIIGGLAKRAGLQLVPEVPTTNELSFDIVYNAAATAPYLVGATLLDADVVWTRPDGTTTATKTPAAAFFNASGSYKVVTADWSKVTGIRMDQNAGRDWLRKVTVQHLLSAASGLTSLEIDGNSYLAGDISSWVLPASLATFAVNSTQVSGDISGWVLPSSLVFSVNSTQVSGDISGWVLPSSLVTFYVSGTQVSGDISSWVLPAASLATFTVNSTQVSGDISGWVLPASLVYFSVNSTQVSGDISSWVLPASLVYFYVYSTQVSYGNGQALRTTGAAANKNFRMNSISVDQAAVDRILVDLDLSGRSGPGTLYYKGTNPAPSATGAAAWTSLAGKNWTSD